MRLISILPNSAWITGDCEVDTLVKAPTLWVEVVHQTCGWPRRSSGNARSEVSGEARGPGEAYSQLLARPAV